MAKDPSFIEKRKEPHLKIKLSTQAIIAKIKSLESHKSQHFAFKKSCPYIPLWFIMSAHIYEYFYVANKGKEI